MNILLHYHWPGNLIQLQNVIERAFAMGVENAIGPKTCRRKFAPLVPSPNGLMEPSGLFGPTPLWSIFF
jgi:DNA-binding NtrC family response regulator